MTAAEAEPIVFIVSYHNLDYAKVACDHVLQAAPDAQKTIRELTNNPYGQPADWVYDVVNGANECKSVRDPRALGRQLEIDLANALAVNTRCGGVTIIRDPHPDFDKYDWSETSQANQKIKSQSDHWDLHLDYSPGHKTFGWTLFPHKAGGFEPPASLARSLISGEGDTTKAANDICTVVTRRGATIR
jgi:hypothetical protein